MTTRPFTKVALAASALLALTVVNGPGAGALAVEAGTVYGDTHQRGDLTCGSTFEIEAIGVVTVSDTQGHLFTGDFELVGVGCERTMSPSMRIAGTSPAGGTLWCDSLAGAFLRTYATLHLTTAGACRINGMDAGSIGFEIEALAPATKDFAGKISGGAR